MSPCALSTVLPCTCLCHCALISRQHVAVCGWSELFLEYKMRSQMETAKPEVDSVVMPTTTTTTTTQLHLAGTPSHRRRLVPTGPLVAVLRVVNWDWARRCL